MRRDLIGGSKHGRASETSAEDEGTTVTRSGNRAIDDAPQALKRVADDRARANSTRCCLAAARAAALARSEVVPTHDFRAAIESARLATLQQICNVDCNICAKSLRWDFALR